MPVHVLNNWCLHLNVRMFFQSIGNDVNQGGDPSSISKQVLEDFKDMFDDYNDRNDSLFGLAAAQWETKSREGIPTEHLHTLFRFLQTLKNSKSNLYFFNLSYYVPHRNRLVLIVIPMSFFGELRNL